MLSVAGNGSLMSKLLFQSLKLCRLSFTYIQADTD